MRLSIVIPCYNEEGCIEEVVTSWIREVSSKISDFDLTVVNDGSKDGTGALLTRLAEKLPQLRVLTQKNQGHGPALLNGYRAAMGQWIFQTDSDRQFLPEDFWALWDLRESTPFVIGIRKKRSDPTHRLILTRLLRWGVKILFGVPVRDINIPYRLIQRDLLQSILPFLPNDSLTPNVLLVVGAVRSRVEFRQVGVTHLPRKTGETVLKPWKLAKFCARALAQLFQFRWRFRSGYAEAR